MIILPSLEIVPAKYNTSTNTLLSQIPIDGTGDFTVTRATSPTTNQSTRVNALGLIELVPDNVPRLDYPIGGGCPALLVEPSAQNIETNSENISVYSIIPGGVQPLSGQLNTEVAPDGATTGDRILETAITDVHAIFRDRTIVSGTTYTFSIFAKSVGGRNVQILGSNGFAGVSAVVDLSNGAILASTGTIAVQNYGGGWYRISLTVTASSTSGRTLIYSASGTSTTFLGDITKGIALWGAQLEANSVPTSYIPTVASGITRAADVITDTTASGVIGQTEGTIYLEVDAPSASSQFFRINVATSNAIHIYKNASDRYQVRIYPSASSIDLTDTSAKSGFVKIAIAYKSGDSALVINGGTPITSATAYSFSAALSTVNFLGGVFSVLPTRIRAAALYPTRLTDTQLALLTSPYTSYSSMASALSYTLG